MCQEVPVDDPSKCCHAAEWDGMTLETWKHQSIWTNSKKSIYVIKYFLYSLVIQGVSIMYRAFKLVAVKPRHLPLQVPVRGNYIN